MNAARVVAGLVLGAVICTGSACQHLEKENAMVQRIKPDQRAMELYEDAPGATVQVSDPIVGVTKNLAAGFTEYLEPSRLEWTFDYDEVFFMLEGYLEVHAVGQEAIEFEVGVLGYIPKGTVTTIVVPKRALILKQANFE